MSGQTYEAHCPNCDADRTVLQTVPYQDDTCATCGSAVPDDEAAG